MARLSPWLFWNREELEKSEYFEEEVVRIFREQGLLEAVETVVCYGLGNFSASKPSQFQLALLLALHSVLKVSVSISRICLRRWTDRELNLNVE